ncbi:MAG: hypothetical protein IJT58_05840 [Synergistaceae bacterium]|nr:hypothetical protein [Synergistaceae bacterium]
MSEQIAEAREDEINASIQALYEAQIAFTGAAEVLGVKDDDDVQALVNEVRYFSHEEAWAAFQELREQAKDIPEMSIEEINAEIRAVRKQCYLVTGNLKHYPAEKFIISPAEMMSILHDDNKSN